MKQCPDCEGKGEVMDWVDDMYGNTSSFWRTCECCEGEGKIPEKEYEIAKQLYPKPNSYYRKMYENNTL